MEPWSRNALRLACAPWFPAVLLDFFAAIRVIPKTPSIEILTDDIARRIGLRNVLRGIERGIAADESETIENAWQVRREVLEAESYNLTLAYENSGIGMRLSYVWREKFLNNNEARAFANPIGIWRRPESSLDFQFNWDVTDNFSVSFDAVNITQDMQQSYYHFADVGTPTLTNFGTTLISRQFAIGARWTL